MNEEKECVRSVKVDLKKCQIPCQGIFADIRKVSSLDYEDKKHELAHENYISYKKFYEESRGNRYYLISIKFKNETYKNKLQNR